MQSVCVFTGSSFGDSAEYKAAAGALGTEIAKRGLRLVYGGASIGLMGAVADAALAGGGKVTGVLPRGLAELEIAHTGLTDLIIVDSMHERKTIMADSTDGFVAMPGGLGTLEETFEVWTWTQLGIHTKPLGFLNVGGYYDALFTFLDQAVASGFVKPSHREYVVARSDPAALLDGLQNADINLEAKLTERPAR